jgi:hypothetical protein
MRFSTSILLAIFSIASLTAAAPNAAVAERDAYAAEDANAIAAREAAEGKFDAEVSSRVLFTIRLDGS